MSDFELRCRGAVMLGAVSGILLALAMCIAFGFLDIQCRDNAAGPFWNAAEQRCQAQEVIIARIEARSGETQRGSMAPPRKPDQRQTIPPHITRGRG